MAKYLVFDIGGTFIKYALMDEEMTMLNQGKVPAPTSNMEDFMAALSSVGEIFAGNFEGVAVSVPGCIDREHGIALTGGAYHFIQNDPLRARLEACFGVPVAIANDAHCAARAEMRDGELAGVKTGCMMVLGTGIGGAIALDGRIIEGASFSASQFSALPTDFGAAWKGVSLPDFAGYENFWGSQISASGLVNAYALRKGELPGTYDGFALFEAYDAGEKEARETLADFGRRAAVGIYAIQSILDLERFVIGGGISARPEVTQVIQDSLADLFGRIPSMGFGMPEVRTSRFGNDGNLRGALQFLLDK